jgi:glycosyltransferase involved in cell wall biosynthesis
VNVLHLIDSGGLYGAENVLLNLMHQQNNVGYKTTLGSIGTSSDGQKAIEKKAVDTGLQIELFRMRNGLNVSGAFRIINYARNNKVDIIHCHGYKSNIILGLLPKKYRNTPYVATLHGWTSINLFTKMWLYEWADALMMKRANGVVVVSKAMLNHTKLKYLNISPVVIYNGIPIKENNDSYSETLLFNGNKNKDLKLISIGRLSKEKGFDILIKSVGYMVSKFKYNVKLCIIGDGPEKNNLFKLTNELNLGNRIVFTGYIPDAHMVLKSFDIFVMSSITEGMPITLLEAMRVGMPIVATAIGGIPEALDNGKCGIVVSPGSEIELARGISQLHEDNRLKIFLSKESMQQFYHNFTVEKMEKNYRSVYDRVINEFKACNF